MSELRKPFLKKLDKKNKKKTQNQCQNAACEQKKPLARNKNLIQIKKLGLWIRPCEWIGKII